MKAIAIVVALLALTAVGAQAQTYTTASTIRWDAPSNAMDAADAASFTYRLYINSTTVFTALTGVVCGPPVAPDVVFSCQAPVLAQMLPGLNKRKMSTTLTAEDTSTPVSGESAMSNVFIVNRKPNAPGNNRAQ